MLLKHVLTLLLSLITFNLLAQDPLLINAYERDYTSLNGYWKYIVDPYENGYYNYRYQPFDQQESPWKDAFFLNSKQSNPSELLEYNFDLMDSLKVPGDWNTQKESLFYYEGTVWYKKSFHYTKSNSSNRVYLYFEAANYVTEVYLNGRKLGKHVGGFTPFNFDATNHLKEEGNFVVVKVDNKRVKDGVPTLNTDWWNYGGITRDVKLIEVPNTHIQDYVIQLKKNDSSIIQGFVKLNGDTRNNQKVNLRIGELNLDETYQTDADGTITFELPVQNIQLWSTTNPKLYNVEISTANDRVTDRIGFRTVTTQGTEILLNGEPVFLRGISMHEESPTRPGRGYSKEDARQLLNWARELGCNFVRLAHYPHNEHMVRLADEMGMLVWEENPVYWTISWDNPDTYQNAENQLAEVINRDKNRASVIIWSMANETPNTNARNLFLNKLASFARSKDSTRLISAALEQKNVGGNTRIRTIDDPFAEVVDILSFNQYIGWYDGLPEKTKSITWQIDQNKPVIISEFGAGAKKGVYGSKTERWTEEFQEDLYQQTLNMISGIEALQGISPWILVDFRSPRRLLPRIQDGWNRKGLISDEGEKKKAFYVLQQFYQEKAMEK
ncbi:MAG: glycoside hydrolase family 2 TIM barrel-domain containing protein [Bacteroidota bacterium]